MSAPPPPAPAPHADGARPPLALVVLVATVGLGVLAQAALAGLFLAGTSGARLPHVVVGWLLPYHALVVAVVAAVMHARRRLPTRLAVAVYPLPVLLWVQEVLGHVPAAATTAVHVPLGVALAVHACVLTALLATARAASPPRPGPPR